MTASIKGKLRVVVARSTLPLAVCHPMKMSFDRWPPAGIARNSTIFKT
jgi:hypothetical protein